MNQGTGMATAPQPSGIMPQIEASPSAPVDPGSFGEYSDWAQKEMANGASAEQLHRKLQESGIQTGGEEKKGNWFTHLLPTIGSMAVPLLGAGLAPVTGGASLIAAAGLSGLGAAAGKAGQNALEGGPAFDENVVKEGAMGAAGGLLGGIGGKVLGKVAGGLAGRAESVAAKTAAEDGIEVAANTYKDIAPKLQGRLNMKDNLDFVKKLGYDVADPSNLVHVKNTNSDVLNEVLNRALAKSGPVDLSKYGNLVKASLAKESGTLGSFEPVAVARGRLGTPNTPAAKLLKELESLGAAPGEAGTALARSNADPNEIRTLVGKIGELMADAKPQPSMTTGAIDPSQKARYNALRDIWGQMKTGLYDRPEVSAAIKGEVGNILPDQAANITPELAEYLNGVVTKSSKAQDLLTEISKGIDIGKLGDEGMKAGQIVTSTGGKARAAMEAGLSNPGMDTNPLLSTVGAATQGNGITGAIGSVASKAKDNPAILKTLSRIGAMGEKLAPAAGAGIATIPNMQADPVGTMQPGGDYGPGGTNGIIGGNMQGDTTGQPGLQEYINAMQAQSVLAPSMGGGASSFMGQVAPQLMKNQLAEGAMQGIPQSFANAGGAQGTGGILSSIASLIPGTAANTYNQQRQAAAAQLAAAMGISPEQAMGLLPNVMQNEQTAGITQGILGNMGGALVN